jgi:hypothetical protein
VLHGDAKRKRGGGGAEEEEPALGYKRDGRGRGAGDAFQYFLDQLITQHHIHGVLLSSIELYIFFGVPLSRSRPLPTTASSCGSRVLKLSPLSLFLFPLCLSLCLRDYSKKRAK